jgi:hypothetical protein
MNVIRFSRRRLGLVLAPLVAVGVGLALACAATTPATAPAASSDVFARRILPIFKSPDPSSCTACHLAGVDLKNYIRTSSEETFLSLRDQGLVNLDAPDQSKILRFIAMTPEKKPGAALISDKVKRQEYDAFAEWIAACANDPTLRKAAKLRADQLAVPPRPVEVIRHDRVDQLQDTFRRQVWAQAQFRCAGCHMEGGAENAKLVKENGDITWLKKTPEATFENLRTSGFVDVAAPEKSLLLLKPLNAVKHGGGQKILPGDMTYKAFRGFLEDYAKVVNDKYATAADLPAPGPVLEHFPTASWLKITNTPPAWGDKLLRVEVFAQDPVGKGWEPSPIAISDRGVSGTGKLWQHTLVAVAVPGTRRAAQFATVAALPAGTYRVRVYVDVAGRLARDWTASLDERDYVGEKIIQTNWTKGYNAMTLIDAVSLGSRNEQPPLAGSMQERT